MTNQSVKMFEINIPLDAIRRLSEEDRYTYYLLGHMFNELISLQKIIGFSLPKHEDMRTARLLPEISQALFFFRMASSKIWEANLKLRSKAVAVTLRNAILPNMTNGPVRLKELNKAINSAKWLADLRNVIGFHFPTFSEWKPFVTPQDDWADDSIYFGEQTGNTFYASADAIAQHWMFQQCGATDIKEAIPLLIPEMIDLLRIMNSFIEDALGVFISTSLLTSNPVRKSVGETMAPQHDLISIPFWTSMRTHQ
ncbi:hypothetical protein ACO0LM_22375 [Undibacterium sp. Di26W]|uniref:hypothetical protein n=1 Tax=Undibacterium sp. Di26W TaxID=3413035 RepID=UPI003BF03F57